MAHIGTIWSPSRITARATDIMAVVAEAGWYYDYVIS